MPKAQILVVDDSSLIRDIVKQILDAWDYDTVLAVNGKDGLEKALDASNNFRLIITDFQMPVMNGIQLLKALRASGNTTPVILFTAMLGDEPGEYKQLEAHGFVVVMKKPFEHEELHQIIKGIVGS